MEGLLLRPSDSKSVGLFPLIYQQLGDSISTLLAMPSCKACIPDHQITDTSNQQVVSWNTHLPPFIIELFSKTNIPNFENTT